MSTPFRLTDAFVNKYRTRRPPFGYNGLGELVYNRTYSRLRADGTKEKWYQTVERVVNGTYSLQKRHIEHHGLGWDEQMGQESAQEMYDRIWHMKFLPPGRGLSCMGAPVIEERGLFAALNNCGFVSTANIATDRSKPFCFLMDMSMLGCGIGFDVKGAERLMLHKPDPARVKHFTIPDSREGWVEGLQHLLESYFQPEQATVQFDYSQLRPAGEPIRCFGGTSSGPRPLRELFASIRATLDPNVGKLISITVITDIMNLIGCCVVAGNVRRSAELALGDYRSDEFVDLKNYARNPQRSTYGWVSNNSVLGEVGMDYAPLNDRIAQNGEPGIVFLDNMRKYGRMNGTPDYGDMRAAGANPCVEQVLEPYELCCLSEVFIARHESKADFLRSLKFSYLYAKTVTLGKTHWAETNRVLLRNRRIGNSITGIAQFLAQDDLETLRVWLDAGYAEVQKYDEIYANWLCIPRSIRTTSIKPSGTISLLAGATPGCHYPSSRYYIRRVRLAANSDLVPQLRDAGYHIEPDQVSAGTLVVSFPIDSGDVRTAPEVSMWEQLSLVASLQRWWSDNSVSATVTFDPETEGPQIGHAMNYFQYSLKAVSFLPRYKNGAFPQMPYEEITAAQYDEMMAKLRLVELQSADDSEIERGCDGDSCTLAVMAAAAARK